MKKVYRFNLIPGVEFVEDDGFYFAMADDPVWPKSHITKVVIEGLIAYERANNELKTKLKNSEFTISVLNDRIEFTKKCAENEIEHRNKLLDEKDKEIEYIRGNLHEKTMESEAYKEAIKTLKEENSNLNKQIIQSPISKSPVPLSSAEDCSDFYICAPDHITYGPIAGGFGIGLYVGDTLILLKGDKANEAVYEHNAMIDKINTLEATLKKKDEMIEELGGIVEFANALCDGYGTLTDTLMDSVTEKNSEIKVLSDQVTRLMDQLKEVMGENSGCKSCSNGPEPCCNICDNTDCEHRVETEVESETNIGKLMYDMFISALDVWLKGTPGCDDIKPCRLTPEMVAEYERQVKTEAKSKTNFDKVIADMHSKLSPERLAEIIKTSECDGVSCKECLFNSIAEPGYLPICDIPRKALVEWLSENIKED